MSRRRNAPEDLLNLASMRQKRDDTSLLSTAGLDPSHVIEIFPQRHEFRRGRLDRHLELRGVDDATQFR
jgi:hypothetical protein